VARNARQHGTTTVKWSTDPEADAKAMAEAAGESARRARLNGAVTWAVAHAGGRFTAFVPMGHAQKFGLCGYHWCPRKVEDCGYHAAKRGAR
jgi:hypothetical protein